LINQESWTTGAERSTSQAVVQVHTGACTITHLIQELQLVSDETFGLFAAINAAEQTQLSALRLLPLVEPQG
jgi:hypothetical protein